MGDSDILGGVLMRYYSILFMTAITLFALSPEASADYRESF